MLTVPSIEPGRRAVITGRTGSGKSTLACWLLSRSGQHWIIFNPKHTGAYKNLDDSVVFKKFEPKSILSKIKRHKFVVLNFRGEEADADFMDAVLYWLHENLRDVGVCCDELYTMHSAAGRAGDGLIGWLTRGRELKQSFLGLTQRPAFISRFVFSEADYIGGMDLVLEDDRKRMRAETGSDHFANRLRGHRWLWYNVAADDITLFKPVPRS
jgi:hypothetical protein